MNTTPKKQRRGPTSAAGQFIMQRVIATKGAEYFETFYEQFLWYQDYLGEINRKSDNGYWLLDYCKDFYPDLYVSYAAPYRIRGEKVPHPANGDK